MKQIIGCHTMKFLAGLIWTLSIALAHPTGNDLKIPRVAGGQTASPGNFPYQVGVRTNRVNEKNQTHSTVCSGSLIAANVVLTSALCVTNGVSAKVYAGAANLSDARQIEVQKEDWLIHDEYDGIDHDIALIFLNESLPLAGNIDIVNLPRRTQQNKSFENVTGLISGWLGFFGNVKPSTLQLQYVYRLILPSASCEKQYLYTDLQVCVDGSNETSPCRGDAGGPLTVREEDGSRTLIGVGAFSTLLCEEGHPTGYTRVTSHLDWIHEKAGVPIRE